MHVRAVEVEVKGCEAGIAMGLLGLGLLGAKCDLFSVAPGGEGGGTRLKSKCGHKNRKNK